MTSGNIWAFLVKAGGEGVKELSSERIILLGSVGSKKVQRVILLLHPNTAITIKSSQGTTIEYTLCILRSLWVPLKVSSADCCALTATFTFAGVEQQSSTIADIFVVSID